MGEPEWREVGRQSPEGREREKGETKVGEVKRERHLREEGKGKGG